MCVCVPHATRDVDPATGHRSSSTETSRESQIYVRHKINRRQMCETMHNSKADNKNRKNNNNIIINIIFHVDMQSPLIEFATIMRKTWLSHSKYDKCNQKVVKQNVNYTKIILNYLNTTLEQINHNWYIMGI